MQQEKIYTVQVQLPDKTFIQIQMAQGLKISELLDTLKENDQISRQIDNEQFILTNLSEGKKFDRVKTKHYIEQLGVMNIKIKIQQNEQQQITVEFILPNNQFNADLGKKMKFAQIVEELKKENMLPKEIDSQHFKFTNLSQRKTIDRIKLKNTIQELGQGKLRVKVQWDPLQMQKATGGKCKQMHFLFDGKQIVIVAEEDANIMELVQQVKNQQQYDGILIPKVAGDQIDSAATVYQTCKRYKNKMIQLIREPSMPHINMSSVPDIKISVVITDGAQKKQMTLQNRSMDQSFENIKNLVDNYAKDHFQEWSQDQQIRLYKFNNQQISRVKPFKDMFPKNSTAISIIIQRVHPGGKY